MEKSPGQIEKGTASLVDLGWINSFVLESQ